ncbi:Uncharacterised protein [Mycobacteroides abscessus subsp. abscessus]|nr:Uncharacterised protein [Mycobacteroides abscessus subsp. abscessus]
MSISAIAVAVFTSNSSPPSLCSAASRLMRRRSPIISTFLHMFCNGIRCLASLRGRLV